MARTAALRVGVLTGVVVVWSLAAGGVSSAAPPGTNTAAAEAVACADLYDVPVSIGPEPLSACQWDMRAIDATPDGSYAVQRGAGARVGVIDTGSRPHEQRRHAQC